LGFKFVRVGNQPDDSSITASWCKTQYEEQVKLMDEWRMDQLGSMDEEKSMEEEH